MILISISANCQSKSQCLGPVKPVPIVFPIVLSIIPLQGSIISIAHFLYCASKHSPADSSERRQPETVSFVQSEFIR